MQKQVLAIHDMSCVGRCSLTVALPVLSAAGIHTSVLPTAVLSTHTGEFTGYTNLDLTEEMGKIAAHFATLPLHFDGLYTGFLGSHEQICLVSDVLRRYQGEGVLTLVDPVMADHGKLYATYTPEMAADMGQLCALADVIVPNLTEAAILLGELYQPEPGETKVQQMLEALAAKYGCRHVIITGIRQGDRYGAASLDATQGRFGFAGAAPLREVFYGTGDVFASALLGALLAGKDTETATQLAVDFTHESMVHTLKNGLPLRYGVAFEQALPGYIHGLGFL